MARVVAPGAPHHVTQRGNRRQQVFFREEDYALYKELLIEGCHSARVEVLAWCLMPNHVHLILVPKDEDGLRAALAETHRRYTRHINVREGWRGFLWQGRFASVAVDENHLMACARYVELNPVRAKLVRRARDWRWSSARAHLDDRADGLVDPHKLLRLVDDWKDFLGEGLDAPMLEAIRRGERTGRPLGSARFIAKLESRLGRTLARQKPGPKPRKRKAKKA